MSNENEYDASDPEQVEAKEKEIEILRKQELEDIKTILKYPSGERFFRRFFEEGKMFCTSFTGNETTYFNEGQRNLALKFFSDVCEICPDKVSQLLIKKGGKI